MLISLLGELNEFGKIDLSEILRDHQSVKVLLLLLFLGGEASQQKESAVIEKICPHEQGSGTIPKNSEEFFYLTPTQFLWGTAGVLIQLVQAHVESEERLIVIDFASLLLTCAFLPLNKGEVSLADLLLSHEQPLFVQRDLHL
jgi:hypothetical protein